MRTISILRWVNGLRALTPGLTVTAPVSARTAAPTTANGTAPTSASGITGHTAGPVGDLRARPAVPVDAAVRYAAPHTAACPAGAPLPGFLHETQPAL
ncbi:hypothetical protein [Streptomyces lydicus]|uniref:hypothetical protein n=1 Tax=Streptomyces lydicus TaxID=47763 RepID=UPI0010123B77|nr:hypothetical protein [Streptomyces lydicus]